MFSYLTDKDLFAEIYRCVCAAHACIHVMWCDVMLCHVMSCALHPSFTHGQSIASITLRPLDPTSYLHNAHITPFHTQTLHCIFRNQLAKRLLNQRSASDEMERLMIGKLKLRCDYRYDVTRPSRLSMSLHPLLCNAFASYSLSSTTE
jgi:hypothetical protein